MDRKAIDTIRFLGVDAVNKANSGHPGIVLGAAPIIHVLYTRHLRVDVKDPKWIDRDRFVLSAGHGSMLLYAANHLAGYDISIDDIKRFRQIGNTPGHPEYGYTDGVETTSGPLGQGISNAIGMALAEAHLSARFNREDVKLIDHDTYVLCSDGDLQEGVAMEAMSLAGHLGLGRLIVLHDSNDIQLDGEVAASYSDDHKNKFEAMGWHYQTVDDGNDIEAIDQAIRTAKEEKGRPSFIEVKTTIGYGTSLAGTSKVHGAAIGLEEATKLRKKLEWPYDPFEVPEDVYAYYAEHVRNRGSREHESWKETYDSYRSKYAEEAEQFEAFLANDRTLDPSEYLDLTESEEEATRGVSGKVIQRLSKQYLNLIGGSADLSTSTKAKGADGDFSVNDRLARNINYGVREHAMGSISNGMVLHGGLKVFAGAFFVFSDYMRPAIRLAAIMGIPTIFVFTHDSVAVGEDGPTHQPVEHLAGLRAMPNLNLIRPADATETIAAWKVAIESRSTPTALALTRQKVANLEETTFEGALRGAYVLSPENERLDGILLASGSEVGLALEVKELLKEHDLDIRVVSMPSHALFEQQDEAYRESVLPDRSRTYAIELGSPMSWYKYAEHIYGLERFGASAPMKDVLEHLSFSAEKIAAAYLKLR
ncbi:MAG: transketolase [Acholeplasmataceae bacterium]